MDETPAPLPPLPTTDSSGWLQSGLTHPGSIPDLGAMASGNDTGSTPPPAGEPDPVQQVPDRTGRTHASADHDTRRGLLGAPWLLPVLIAATSLAVGMVLGALLFGGRADKAAGGPAVTCPEPAAAASPGSGP